MSFFVRASLFAYATEKTEVLIQEFSHMLIQLRGWRDAGSAHDSYSLGSTPNVPDLTDGEMVARIVYRPMVQPQDIFGGNAFQATAHAGESSR